jgi:hypothetical protein
VIVAGSLGIYVCAYSFFFRLGFVVPAEEEIVSILRMKVDCGLK